MSADAASTSNQRGGTKGKREPNNVVQVTDGDDDATTVKFEALKRRVVRIMGVEAVKRENEDGGVFEAWFQGRCLGTSAGATDEDLWWAIYLRDEAIIPREPSEGRRSSAISSTATPSPRSAFRAAAAATKRKR